MLRQVHAIQCIGCPVGCGGDVVVEDGAVVDMTGFTCAKGQAYAAEEVVSPCAQRWHDWSPFDEEKGCATCKMLPICMGGCAFSGMTILNNVPECIKFKFNLEETLVKKAAQLRRMPA